MIDAHICKLLEELATKYETAEFIEGDPSWFMHQVVGDRNREAMAFLAASISYGSRKQFLPKIEWMRQRAEGEIDTWIRSGRYEHDLPANDNNCFYRLNTICQMHSFLKAYQSLMMEYGSLGDYIYDMAKSHSDKNKPFSGIDAVAAITSFFAAQGSTGVIPKDTSSACKRVCMFLRWMVRSGSPVDLGLWAEFIDRRTLIMPLDTHVVQQSMRLDMLHSRSTSMAAAQRLTAALTEVFPTDPLRGDFALFGYGVNHAS